jgi:hypothetical protein
MLGVPAGMSAIQKRKLEIWSMGAVAFLDILALRV